MTVCRLEFVLQLHNYQPQSLFTVFYTFAITNMFLLPAAESGLFIIVSTNLWMLPCLFLHHPQFQTGRSTSQDQVPF